jgi:hypothetical protein
MAQSAIDKIPPGPELDALTAETVFGKIAGRKVAERVASGSILISCEKIFKTLVEGQCPGP